MDCLSDGFDGAPMVFLSTFVYNITCLNYFAGNLITRVKQKDQIVSLLLRKQSDHLRNSGRILYSRVSLDIIQTSKTFLYKEFRAYLLSLKAPHAETLNKYRSLCSFGIKVLSDVLPSRSHSTPVELSNNLNTSLADDDIRVKNVISRKAKLWKEQLLIAIFRNFISPKSQIRALLTRPQ